MAAADCQAGRLYTMYPRPRESCFSNERDSSANGCSTRLRAPLIHQISRCHLSAASVCSIAITGVAPTPALSRTTGLWLERRVKLPRGALTSNTSPSRVRLHRNELPIPFNSFLTLMPK